MELDALQSLISRELSSFDLPGGSWKTLLARLSIFDMTQHGVHLVGKAFSTGVFGQTISGSCLTLWLTGVTNKVGINNTLTKKALKENMGHKMSIGTLKALTYS